MKDIALPTISFKEDNYTPPHKEKTYTKMQVWNDTEVSNEKPLNSITILIGHFPASEPFNTNADGIKGSFKGITLSVPEVFLLKGYLDAFLQLREVKKEKS
ncbi:MAG: hypothetical protein M1391_14630 [Bacteroidetes bacterium]|nr:hypothetical protein [Bacteroidota bacterium]